MKKTLEITIFYNEENEKYLYQTSDNEILDEEFDTREEALKACKTLWSDSYWNRIDTENGCIINRNC